MRALHFPAPAARRGHVGLPNARILVDQADDGRWMWGLSFTTALGGEGFHPLPKWGRSAASEHETIEAAVGEFIDRVSARSWVGNPQAAELARWAESIIAPVQEGLF